MQKWDFCLVKVQLISASSKDIPAIQSLANQIWQAHYPAIIGQQQVDYMLDMVYKKDSLEMQMLEGQKFYLILCDGNTCGFLSVIEKEPNHYFIHKFYIAVAEHGKGIGSMAFAELQKLYPNAHKYSLQVNRQNHKPINFYFKLGFIIEKVADFDIGNGYFMNDFVMVYSVK